MKRNIVSPTCSPFNGCEFPKREQRYTNTLPPSNFTQLENMLLKAKVDDSLEITNPKSHEKKK